MPAPVAPLAGGGRLDYPNGAAVVFSHDADASFVGHSEASAHPLEDAAQTFKALVAAPRELLARSPGKFLLLNAEARVMSGPEVRELAKKAGVDLNKVLTDLAIGGRMTPETLKRVAEHHGLRVNREAVMAHEQVMLARGGTLEALVSRLASDLALRGPGSARAVAEARELLATHGKLVAALPLTADPTRVGLPAGQRAFAWVSQGLSRLAELPLRRIDAQLADVRAQFQQLPLAAQLRVSPELALGATWFRLSPAERQLLRDPVGLQGLVSQAAEGVEELAYVPQQLNATERRSLAVRTLVDALLDTGESGRVLRGRLGAQEPGGRRPAVTADPATGLKDLTATNGESVLKLLSEGARRSLADRQNAAALKQLLAEPVLRDAIATLRGGGLGSEALRTAVMRYALEQGRRDDDVVGVVRGLVQTLEQERARFVKSLDGGALELTLVEIARQVREGNVGFVAAFTRDGDEALEQALGPWITRLLSDSERKLLADGDYRRHIVEDARQEAVTGQALAEEARVYRVQTENLQATLDLLTQPDQAFRREFEQDPVGALVRRGIFPHLPAPLQESLARADRAPRIEAVVRAVEQALSPVLQRKLQREQELRNLQAAVRTVNAGNYRPLLGLLEEDDASISRQVRQTMEAALAGGREPFSAGLVRFV